MLSPKRKIKKKTGLFLAFIFTTSFSAFAGQDINLTANVKNSTCQSGISNQGNIDPVSYTHLDVYKRQVIMTMIIPCSK